MNSDLAMCVREVVHETVDDALHQPPYRTRCMAADWAVYWCTDRSRGLAVCLAVYNADKVEHPAFGLDKFLKSLDT
jgi:hypothetical protein